MSVPDHDNWRVRPATKADIDKLALIGAATFVDTFSGILDGDAIVQHCAVQHAPSAYARHFYGGGAAWLAETEIGGAAIGFATLGQPDLAAAASDGSDIELKRIYALSRFHGSGIGLALLQQVIHAANRTAKRLLLGVYHHNHRAIGFYKKHGFIPIAERQFQIGDKLYDDLVLAKTL